MKPACPGLLTFLLGLILAMVVYPLGASVVAETTTRVVGGGTGTFGADLDGDGDIDGSQFGVGGLIFADGSAQGNFVCLMAGRSDFLGLHLMAVKGKVLAGSMNVDGSVTLTGTAFVNLANEGIFKNVPFTAKISAGGPGVGSLTLTVIGAFEGVPGDTIIGNGNYDLPKETLTSGLVTLSSD